MIVYTSLFYSNGRMNSTVTFSVDILKLIVGLSKFKSVCDKIARTFLKKLDVRRCKPHLTRSGSCPVAATSSVSDCTSVMMVL